MSMWKYSAQVLMPKNKPAGFLSGLWWQFQKYYYYKAYWCQLGLMRDDTWMSSEIVEEAVRRLPQHMRDDRTYRIRRAFDLSCAHRILPKDEWTKPHEDYKYLQPYIEEVLAEKQEKKAWNKNH